MRVAAAGTTSRTRPTTRSTGDRSGRSNTVQGHQNRGRHCDQDTSRSSMSHTRNDEVRSAEQYDFGDRGPRGSQGDGHVDQEEPSSQADGPSEGHLQISLTGRRRRFALNPPWEVWFAESSQCFHRRQECRGLRKANRIQGHPICGRCQQVMEARGQRGLAEASHIFEDQLGTHHVDARCAAVTGTMLEIRQCKLCRTNGLS